MGIIGSYIRFGLGILLSAEVLRMVLFGQQISPLAFWLSVIYMISAALYFVFLFTMG